MSSANSGLANTPKLASTQFLGFELFLTVPEINELVNYVSIIVLALIPLYLGCHMSLSQKKPKSTKPGKEETIQYDLETMSFSDVWKYPLFASCFLFGLYCLYKYFSKDIITLLLNLYLLIFGISSLLATFRPIPTKIYSLLTNNQATDSGNGLRVWKLSIPFILDEPLDVTILDGFTLIICLSLNAWYLISKHWIANNIIAIAFAIQGIALISIGSYKIGASILSALIAFDVFWVFGTDVMVTVAKSFEGPIKVLWPKDLLASTYSFSMLGLGDIVIPGLFLALLLRYDVQRSAGKQFTSPYFNICFFGYIMGLLATMVVMHVFKAAQPALLYLVPACLIFSLGAGIYLKDLKGLFNYSEIQSSKAKED